MAVRRRGGDCAEEMDAVNGCIPWCYVSGVFLWVLFEVVMVPVNGPVNNVVRVRANVESLAWLVGVFLVQYVDGEGRGGGS